MSAAGELVEAGGTVAPSFVGGGGMEFLILGPLEVREREKTVRLGAAKQRALLGVLLLHANETVSTARLVDELWGERPPATAEKLVQGYVHALRKQLGDGVARDPGARDTGCASTRARSTCSSSSGWSRRPGRRRSAHSIELRRRALALWRGPPLADVALEGPDAAQRRPSRASSDSRRRSSRSTPSSSSAATHSRRRARGARRRAPLPGAARGAAHARPLPLGTAGRRARGLPHGPRHG